MFLSYISVSLSHINITYLQMRIKKYSYEDVKYSTGGVVNSSIISMYVVRWVLDLLWRSLCKVYEYLITMLYTWN